MINVPVQRTAASLANVTPRAFASLPLEFVYWASSVWAMARDSFKVFQVFKSSSRSACSATESAVARSHLRSPVTLNTNRYFSFDETIRNGRLQLGLPRLQNNNFFLCHLNFMNKLRDDVMF